MSYYRSRYFDARVGRFLSEDPIGFGGGDANLYRYVGNSPTNYTDPTGLFAETLLDVAMIGYDLYRIYNDNIANNCGNLGENLTSLGLNIASAALPFVPALGAIGRGADDAADAFRNIGSATESSVDYVYRGDLRSPEEILAGGEGFRPWNPRGTMSLEDHVNYVDPRNSQWVSTSTDIQSAAGFAVNDSRYGYVYRIRRPPGGVDVNQSLGLESLEREIAFSGGIPEQYIDGSWRIVGETTGSQGTEFTFDAYSPFRRR